VSPAAEGVPAGFHEEKRDTPSHIADLEGQIAQLRQALLAGAQPQTGLLEALQTIPGLDEAGAAMLLVEIGDDMQAFGSAEKLASWPSVCPSGKA
jgi:transposase